MEFRDCATPGQMARYEGVCCPRACGKCGGGKCFERPGGRAECCASEVLASNRSCANAEPPCVIDRTANARRRLPSWIAPQGLLRGVFRLTEWRQQTGMGWLAVLKAAQLAACCADLARSGDTLVGGSLVSGAPLVRG